MNQVQIHTCESRKEQKMNSSVVCDCRWCKDYSTQRTCFHRADLAQCTLCEFRVYACKRARPYVKHGHGTSWSHELTGIKFLMGRTNILTVPNGTHKLTNTESLLFVELSPSAKNSFWKFAFLRVIQWGCYLVYWALKKTGDSRPNSIYGDMSNEGHNITRYALRHI